MCIRDSADTLRIGRMDPALGFIEPWWDLASGTLMPVGDRAIGTSAAPVQTVTTTTINAGTLSLIYKSNPIASFNITNKGIHSVPVVSQNLVI